MNAKTRPVAVLGGNRIPFARSNGAYAKASNQDMLTAALGGLIDRFGLEGERIGEVSAGAVLKHSRDFNLTREAVLGSKLAPETPAYDVGQACGTGLEATILVANKIALGQEESAIAGGADTTSDAPIALNDDLREILLEVNNAKSNAARLRAVDEDPPRPHRPRDPAQRRAPHRALDGRAHGDHGARVGRHPRGAGRARGRLARQPRRRLRPRLLRRPDDLLSRPRARPEPARRLERREAGEAEAGVRRRGRDDDRRQLDPALRRRVDGAARQRGLGEGATATPRSRTSSTPRRRRSTTSARRRAC